MERKGAKVCVTGGSGYIASWLIRKLLLRGYTVHTTLRNLEDRSKVDFLRSLPNGDTNLVLFQADLLNPAEFEPAIQGCESVFHVAHPVLFGASKDQLENLTNVVVEASRSIADSCIRSGSVKRLIYTGSVLAMSPLNEDGTGYRSSILDESTWTPLDAPITCSVDSVLAYTRSKTLAEKELLKYNDRENSRPEVVSLDCAEVAGETIHRDVPLSTLVVLSPILGDHQAFFGLKYLQDVVGSVPLVHIDDVCEAHIFCAEKQSMKGRFLCSATSVSIREISAYFRENYPEWEITEEFMGDSSGSKVRCDNSRLIEIGFEYKYNLKEILDDSVRCGRRLGALISKKMS
ncbi:hypothetical protein CRG98_044175 [Punica granatum]|uniref:NAD-dependent epimerase/dehydratase domain-containing protein n=1 Tax=Punica granatum TaxID=22663 RepID=A0A2I0HUQ4_PUNGR|nr:hypothetical protein CRG98_044175 [Punica granatum]